MKRKSNCFVTILFLIYLALLVWIILFKLQFSISDLDKIRSIREAGKGIVKSTGGTYQIGFTDLYGEEHETELSAHNMKELEELWRSLCPEFTCRQNSIRYIEQG